ncbi:MAG: nuclear transport factor 2 family protein [Rhodospirillaceae bacterium]
MIIEEIRAVLAAKASALVRRSADDMAVLMHPDFVHVTAGGRTLTKADYIDVFINSEKVVYHSQEVRELEVHLFDAVCVATMAVDDRCSIDGREITETFRALSVYTWKDERWLWVAGQTALPRQP